MKDNSKRYIRFFIGIQFMCCLVYTANSLAAPDTILSAEISEKHVTHAFRDDDPTNRPEFAGDFGSVIIGLTTVFDKFYVNLNSEQSWKDDTAVFNSSLLYMDRDDYALTLGYAVSNTTSVFAGYKYGKTGFTNASLEAGSTVASTFSFKEEGPFIGIAYTHSISNKSSVGLSLAYADMDGEVNNHTLDAGEAGTGPTDGSGKVDGISVGIKYANALSDSTQLILGIKSVRYDSKGTAIDYTPYEIESEYDYVTLGLSYYF